MAQAHAQVSFDDEPLVLVDEHDTVLGYESKQRCHDGAGLLHRAFSVFLFDASGALLLQQRSATKRLWPLFWSNSCCSHPRRGEETQSAAERRVREELGLVASLRAVYAFTYRARYAELGSEYELCHVLYGRQSGSPRVNDNEIAACRLVTPAALDRELVDSPELFTPWLKLEWQRLRRDYWPSLVF